MKLGFGTRGKHEGYGGNIRRRCCFSDESYDLTGSPCVVLIRIFLQSTCVIQEDQIQLDETMIDANCQDLFVSWIRTWLFPVGDLSRTIATGTFGRGP